MTATREPSKKKAAKASAPAGAPSESAAGSPATASAPSPRSPRTGRIRQRSAKEIAEMHVAAALIVAHNQARKIAATVRAARAIPGVDLVLVVDDASTDNTQDLARRAGAVVVRNSHYRGRSVSVEVGASVIAMRDEPGREPRALLILPGSLGHFAIGAAPLVPPVTEHVCDLAVALTETQAQAQGNTSAAARRAIEHASHWTPQQPLGQIRCITREALEAVMPLARGAGLEVAMTLDVLHHGYTVTEVECDIRHKPTTGSGGSVTARAGHYRDVMVAVGARRVRTSLDNTRTAIARRRASGEDDPVAEVTESPEDHEQELTDEPSEFGDEQTQVGDQEVAREDAPKRSKRAKKERT